MGVPVRDGRPGFETVFSGEASPSSVTRRKRSSGRSNDLRRQNGVGSTLTLRELVEEYLAQHDAEPETINKLGWLLAKAARVSATAAFASFGRKRSRRGG